MIAVNLAVVSIVFVPYFLLIYIGQREYRKIDNLFKKEAKKNDLKIEVKDRWNLNAIGIDSRQQKLLFVQRRNEEFFVQLVNLSNIKESKIFQYSKSININGVNELVLQKIDLELVPFNSDEKTIISLFDSDLTFDQDFEMKHAEKWNRLINSTLSVNPITRKVA